MTGKNTHERGSEGMKLLPHVVRHVVVMKIISVPAGVCV